MVLARVGELEEEQLSTLVAWVRAAQERGELRPDLPPELAAHFVDTQFMTVLTQVVQGQPVARIRAVAKLAGQALRIGRLVQESGSLSAHRPFAENQR